jgi:hypothetical protein
VTGAALALALGAAASVASAQSSTTFTYQGELSDGSGPVTGLHDFRFRLYTSAGGLVQLGSTLCLDNVQVTQGRFTVTLDFGDQFSVIGRHLETEVRPDAGLNCNSSAGFTILGPLQPITSVPAASFAFNAATLAGQQISFFQNAGNMTSGTLPAGRLAGTYSNALTLNNAGNVFAGSGSSLTSLNATNITTGTLADARIPTTIPRLNVANAFTGPTNIFAGGVGINTSTTLAADLHVRPVGTATLGKLLVTPGTSDSSSQLTLAENTSASLGAILRYDGAANQLQMIGLTTGGVETGPHMTIGRDNGRVGIGSAPETRLHVASGSAGFVGVASTAVAILENAGDAHLQLQVPDGSSAGLLFGTPTLGSSAARLQFEDSTSLLLKAYLDPAFATVQIGSSFINVGDATHFVSANVTGSLNVRELTSQGGDRMSYGPSAIEFIANGSIAFPSIEFASGNISLLADRTRPTGWGEFSLTVNRAFLGTPLDIENVGGSSGQGSPVLRLRRAAADGERLLEMTSIGGTYLGFISRDGGGVAYQGFTGLHAAWGEGVKAGELVVMTSGDTAGRSATAGTANALAMSSTLKSLTPVEPGMPAEPVYNIATSTTANAPGVLGITRYAMDISREVSADNPWAVAAVGNTNVWVVDTGKDVEPGDSLITSDVPGAAQVDDPERFEVGNIFGRAAQKVVWSEIAPGPDGKRRAFISVLLDSSVRDARPTAALQQRVQDLETRLQALEAMFDVQGQSGK